MRLFIAVNFNDEVKSRILEIQQQLRSQAYKGSFSRPENFHLTLAFLGETPEEKLEILSQIIEEIQSPAFDIVFNRTGCFTHSRKELWWIGAEPEEDCASKMLCPCGARRGGPDSPGIPHLKAIHGQLIDRLEKEGFSVDKRPFNAHITLAREIKHTSPMVIDCPEITVRVDRISLMKSENFKGALTYTELFGRQLELRTEG